MIVWAELSALDWVIIVVLSLSVLLSLWRGFVREAISLAGWVVAFIVANLFVDEMASFLSSWVVNVTGRFVLAYAILFVSTLVLTTILQHLAASVVKVSGLSVLDRVLGTAFGLARGVILILVVVYLLRQLLPPQELQWLAQSQLMPHLDMVGQWAQMLFIDVNNGQGITVAS